MSEAKSDHKYRALSRIVAIIDLFYSVFAIFVFVVLVVYAAYITNHFKEAGAGGHVWPLWICVVLEGVATFVEFLAAVKLFNGTRVGVNPNEALSKARFWRVVWIVSTFLFVLSGGFARSWIAVLLVIFFKILLLYPVIRYIIELEDNLAEEEEARNNKSRKASAVSIAAAKSTMNSRNNSAMFDEKRGRIPSALTGQEKV